MYPSPRRHSVLLLWALLLAACAPAAAAAPAQAELPALPPASCPVTTPPSPVFTPPGVTVTYPGQFWYGTAALWADLPAQGVWAALPQDAHGYGNKLFFGREGYDAYAEPEPALTVSGRRLDAEAAPLETLPATNGLHAEVGHFMLAGGNFPTAGCWEVTAAYAAGTPAAASLTYVIWIAP